MQVLTDSDVAFVPQEAVKKLCFERPNIGVAMWHDTLVDASIFREWVANVGRRDAPARIAHFLCQFSLRLKVAGLGESTDDQDEAERRAHVASYREHLGLFSWSAGRGLGVDRRPTDIAGLVEQVVAEVQIVNPERGIQTHCDIKANVRCDPVRIAQLLSNPVGNAIFSR